MNIRYFATSDGPGTFAIIDQDVPFPERTLATDLTPLEVVETLLALEHLDAQLAEIPEAHR